MLQESFVWISLLCYFLGRSRKKNPDERILPIACPVELQVLKRVCRTVPYVKIDTGLAPFLTPRPCQDCSTPRGRLGPGRLLALEGDWPAVVVVIVAGLLVAEALLMSLRPCVVVAVGVDSRCRSTSDSSLGLVRTWLLVARCCRWRPAEAFFGNRGWLATV